MRSADGKTTRRLAIVGNPNVGKTTLFNALTGREGKVGNWSGVTLGADFGIWECGQCRYEVIDLPGLYSIELLRHVRNDDAIELPEEEIAAANFILEEKVDFFIQVISPDRLGRDLFLTLELIELSIPLVLVVNNSGGNQGIFSLIKRKIRSLCSRFFGDFEKISSQQQDLNKPEVFCDVNLLKEKLGCEVIEMDIKQRDCWKNLRDRICAINGKFCDNGFMPPAEENLTSIYPEVIRTELEKISDLNPRMSLAKRKEMLRQAYHEGGGNDGHSNLIREMFSAQQAYVSQLVKKTVKQKDHKAESPLLSYLEKCLLNDYIAMPLFAVLMWMIFFLSTHISDVLKPVIGKFVSLLVVEPFVIMQQQFGLSPLFSQVWQGGIGVGVETILNFLPMLAALYFFMGLLEESGYMVRIAIVLDKVLESIGLSCKAVIPLIMGFGCNVPALMAIKTVGDRRQRLIAAMMIPFISCGARLAVLYYLLRCYFHRMKL